MASGQSRLGWASISPLCFSPRRAHPIAPHRRTLCTQQAGDRKGIIFAGTSHSAYLNTPTLHTLCASDLPIDGFASLSWAGLFKVRNAKSTRTAHRRTLLVTMAFPSVACCGRTSARPAGVPSGSALAAPLPFVVRSRHTAEGRRERADSCVAGRISAVSDEYQRLPGFAGCS